MSCRSSVSRIPAEFSLNSISHQSPRAYFKGRAYIKIILENNARSYLSVRSYCRGNMVVAKGLLDPLKVTIEQPGIFDAVIQIKYFFCLLRASIFNLAKRNQSTYFVFEQTTRSYLSSNMNGDLLR